MLLAALANVGEHTAYRPGGDNDFDGRCFDWSTRVGDRRALDVANGDGEEVTVWMSDDELRGLHAVLTVYLLTKES